MHVYHYLEHGCADGWKAFESSCYIFIPNKVEWSAAQKECSDMNSDLVSIHSEEENNFVMTLQGDPPSVRNTWLGGQRDGKHFYWPDGEFDYKAWDENEPNELHGMEHCIEMYSKPQNPSKHKKWNDIRCNEQNSFVCKKKKGGNNH